MDPAALIGVLLAFGAVFGSMIMEGGDPASILLLPPLILVIFGTFGAAMTGGILKDAIGVFKLVPRAFTAKKVLAGELVDTVVKLADRARREGLLALEDAAKDVDDEFLRKGLELAIDGTDPEELRAILESEVEAKRKADRSSAKIFNDMGGFSPTIGIIGTVLGLVHVLENLSKPDKLGHLIAGAFVATLWGVMLANVLWLPLANRLKRVGDLECAQMSLAIEGILAIQAGANPRLVAQKLRSLLPPDERPGEQAA
ncbi:MAG: flagellar motor protein [Actinobacteria bacterium]|nr:flagellar motor protein [Actinomycetota bacterium]